MEDVAARAGVSRALVSIVVRGVPGASEETRRRVLGAAAEIGYRPDNRARLLSRSRSRLLGVVFGVQHAFHGDLVEGIYLAAERLGYEVALSALTPSRDEERAIQALLDDRCEALVVLGPESPARRLAALAAEMPVVVVARSVREPAVDVVRTADAEGLRLAVGHLASLGHRRITHVDGGRAPGTAERVRGYRDAMRVHGLTRHVRVLPGGTSEDAGSAAARRLLDGSRLPTAVAVFNDRCAVGVLDTLLRAGVAVPDDMSVVGFDDSRLARLSTVNLTTVAQDAARMADLAVTRAVDRVERRPVGAREVVIPPRLVVRATSGPPADVDPAVRQPP